MTLQYIGPTFQVFGVHSTKVVFHQSWATTQCQQQELSGDWCTGSNVWLKWISGGGGIWPRCHPPKTTMLFLVGNYSLWITLKQFANGRLWHYSPWAQLSKWLECTLPRSPLVSPQLNTPQGRRRELNGNWCTGFNVWLKCDFGGKFQYQFHARIVYKPIYMTHDF